MPGPAPPSHSRAPSQTSHQLSPGLLAPYAQLRPIQQPHDPRRARHARVYRAPYQQHRRHCSSVADDFDSDFELADFDARLSLFSIAAAISPLSPRWSLVPPDSTNKDEVEVDEEDDVDTENDKNNDDEEDAVCPARGRTYGQSPARTSTQIPLSLLFNSQTPRSTVVEPAGDAAARLSMLSTTSTLSTPSTTSTTSTLRRFWSPSSAQSAPSSPPLSSSATLTPGPASTAPSTAPSSTATAVSPATAPPSPPDYGGDPIPCAVSSSAISAARLNRGRVVTYIPPLVDATGGTLPRWQRRLLLAKTGTAAETHADDPFAATSPYRLLSADLLCLAHTAPELLGLVWTRAVWPLLRLLLVTGRAGAGGAPPPVPLHLLALPFDEVVDAGETALQLGLALFGMGLLVATPVLFLCLPGALFLAWLVVCFVAARVASWPLNTDGSSSSMPVAPWSIDDGETPAKEVDETWFFVSGLGATTRSLAKTGPRLAAVFGRPVTVVRPGHTYGMAADLAYAVLQRLLLPFCEFPATGADVLYSRVRRALMAPPNPAHSGGLAQQRSRHRRVVILAHNTGAITVSQALARLQVDVPATRLTHLEIYTFGSLAPDFVLPTGKTRIDADTMPHVEHVAHVRDPCARFGVLRTVYEDLVGRYCGGVFVLGNEKNEATGSHATMTLRPVRRVSHRDCSPIFRDIGSAPTRATQRRSVAISSANRRLSLPLSFNQHKQYHQQQKCQASPAINTTNPKNAKRWSTGLASSFSPSNHRSSQTSSMEQQQQQQAPPSVWSLGSVLTAGRKYTSHRSMVSMEDYLTALFGPEPWSMRPDVDGGSLSLDAYFAVATIAVDRELAEKREMAAIAQAPAVSQIGSTTGPGDGHTGSKVPAARLSWTGLGATATYTARTAGAIGADKRLADDDGLLGLEAARRCCHECDGQSGRDVSHLAGYFLEAVVWHRERFGY